MKVKTKFGAFTLALALGGLVLAGCGSNPTPGPTPPSSYNVVCTKEDAKYTVNGLQAKYTAGSNVAFTITENDSDNYKVTGVTSSQVTVTTVSTLSYSFTMPESDVSLSVGTRAVDKYSVSVPEDIIVGQPAKVTVKLGQSEVINLKIEKLSTETKSCTIASPKITFNEPGDFHFKLVDGDRNDKVISEDYKISARNAEQGETPDNPYSASKAYEEASKLEKDVPSEKSYYVEGVVKSISFYPNKSGGTGSCVLDAGSNNFEVYKAMFTAAQAEVFDVGSKIIVHAQLKLHNNTRETTDGEIYSVDNSTPVKLLADIPSAVLREVGETVDPQFRIAPRGSSDQLIEFESSDTSVATVNANGVITAAGEGTATVTASSAGYDSVSVSVIVSSSIHAGTENDPLTADDAILMTKALGEGNMSRSKYYIKGAVCEVKEHHHDSYTTSTFKLAGTEETFTVYRVNTSAEQDAAIVKGAIVVVQAKLYNYSGTLETNSASFISVDASAIGLVELQKTKLEISLQDGDFDLTGFASAYPDNINGAVIEFASENNEVFTIVEGKIHPVAEGTARLVASCGKVVAYCLVKVTTVHSIVMATSLEAGQDYVLATPLSTGNVFCQAKMATGGARFYISGSTSLDDAAVATVAVGEEADYKYTISLFDGTNTKVLGTAMNSEEKEGTVIKHYNLGFVGDNVPDTEIPYETAKFKFTDDYRLETVVDGEVFEVGTQSGKTTFSLGKPSESKVVPSHLYIVGDPVPATGVTVEPSEKTLAPGEAATLTAKLEPAESTDVITWSSSDEAVAKVDSATGKVTAVANGSATITATTSSGVKGTCAVTVEGEAVNYGTLDNPITPERAVELLEALGDNVLTPVKMYVGGVVGASDAMGKNGRSIYLASSDGKTAQYFQSFMTVDGSVEGLPAEKDALVGYSLVICGWGMKYVGNKTTYELTNRDASGAYDNPLIMSATAPTIPDLERVDISGAKTVKEGSKITLTAAPYPARAVMGTVTWSSSDPTVATVDSATGVVTGVKASETPVTITATESSLGKTGTYQVTVVSSSGPTEQTVTLTAADFTAVETTIVNETIGDVNFATSIACTITSEQVRVFKNAVFTVSVAGGTISSISFECTANGTSKYGPGCFGTVAPEGYTFEADGKNGTWAGSSESVAFTATSNQVRIVKITITYTL